MTVAVVINGKDMHISTRLREYVEKNVGRLDHYLTNITEARVDLAEVRSARSATDRHVAQITIHHTRGAILRAEERHDDIFAAVDAVLEKIQRQMERYKGRLIRGRGNGAGAETVAVPPEEEASELPGDVVRRKRFALVPMNEAEALEQMQHLSHDNFFVFYNADTSRVNVLYRRRSGGFGLIDPEIG